MTQVHGSLGGYYHLEDFQQYLPEIHENCQSKDCWDTLEFIYNNCGISIKIEKDFENAVEKNIAKFEIIEKSKVRPLDLLLFKGLTDSALHFGIYIGDRKFIHQYRGTIAITKLTKLWRICWYGTYRYKEGID